MTPEEIKLFDGKTVQLTYIVAGEGRKTFTGRLEMRGKYIVCIYSLELNTPIFSRQHV